MSNRRGEEQRRVAIVGGSVAAMSGGAAMLSQRHPFVIWVYGAFLVVAFAYVMTQLVKIRRQRRQRREGRL